MRALKISANAENGPLSPAQKRFNTLLTKVETLTEKIEATRRAVDAHRPRAARELGELEQRQSELMQKMVLLLDQRLRGKGLTAAQKSTATEILITLSESLAAEGDADMQAIHDQHSPQDLADKQGEAAQEMKQMMEAMLGTPIAHEGDPDDLESLLQAAMLEMERKFQAEHEQRQAAQASRRSKKAKTAKQKQAEEEVTDAQSALRTLFRQLASALHPDRETDPDERARKTALMSEVNSAYQRRDLTALLQLQLRAELVNPQAIASMAEKKVAALSLLLKEQVSALERDLAQLDMQARDEFDLPWGLAPITSIGLARALTQQCRQIAQDIAFMQQDLRRLQDDADFKRWLKEQARAAKQSDPFDELDALMAMRGFGR